MFLRTGSGVLNVDASLSDSVDFGPSESLLPTGKEGGGGLLVLILERVRLGFSGVTPPASSLELNSIPAVFGLRVCDLAFVACKIKKLIFGCLHYNFIELILEIPSPPKILIALTAGDPVALGLVPLFANCSRSTDDLRLDKLFLKLLKEPLTELRDSLFLFLSGVSLSATTLHDLGLVAPVGVLLPLDMLIVACDFKSLESALLLDGDATLDE